jgi:pyrroline-5-carboxylate reductase
MLPREKLLFLGGGRITSAIVEGLRRAGFKGVIAVYDRHPSKLKKLEGEFEVGMARDLGSVVGNATILVIAVRPESVNEILEDIALYRRPAGHRRTPGVAQQMTRVPLAISLAAGVPLAQLRRRLGPPIRWARAMPSPACSSGRGLTALAFDRSFPRTANKRVRNLFGGIGTVVEISESKFDVFTAAYSVSHGYHALAALSLAAMRLGLDRRTAEIAAAHALADGILSWREKRTKLSELLREAATPGGIAEAVMKSEEQAGYSRIVEQALRAGVARAQSLRKR